MIEMKKFIMVVGILFILGAAGVFALTKMDFNRMNADDYYLQITEEGVQHETKLDDGSVMTYYSYKLDAKNADGETIPLWTPKMQMVKRYHLNSRHKKIFEKTLT
jgi:uncharacterized protein YxeA